MLLMERIPDQVGYLVLTQDGAVLAVKNNYFTIIIIISIIKKFNTFISCIYLYYFYMTVKLAIT